jgi:hypothetical protein
MTAVVLGHAFLRVLRFSSFIIPSIIQQHRRIIPKYSDKNNTLPFLPAPFHQPSENDASSIEVCVYSLFLLNLITELEWLHFTFTASRSVLLPYFCHGFAMYNELGI